MRSQLCFPSLPPSITVVSEEDNLIKNNKNDQYDSTQKSYICHNSNNQWCLCCCKLYISWIKIFHSNAMIYSIGHKYFCPFVLFRAILQLNKNIYQLGLEKVYFVSLWGLVVFFLLKKQGKSEKAFVLNCKLRLS